MVAITSKDVPAEPLFGVTWMVSRRVPAFALAPSTVTVIDSVALGGTSARYS